MSNKLVPAGKVVKLKLSIRRGNYNDPSQGWTDGYATKASTGSIYLNVEYSVTEGVYEVTRARVRLLREVSLSLLESERSARSERNSGTSGPAS